MIALKIITTAAVVGIIAYMIWAILTTKKEEYDDMLNDKNCTL